MNETEVIEECASVMPAFDQDSGAWTCEHCGNDIYSACPTCAIKQVKDLEAQLKTAVEALEIIISNKQLDLIFRNIASTALAKIKE